jgi:hypothetical protein
MRARSSQTWARSQTAEEPETLPREYVEQLRTELVRVIGRLADRPTIRSMNPPRDDPTPSSPRSMIDRHASHTSLVADRPVK